MSGVERKMSKSAFFGQINCLYARSASRWPFNILPSSAKTIDAKSVIMALLTRVSSQFDCKIEFRKQHLKFS